MKAYGTEDVQVHKLLTLCSCTLCHQTIFWPLFAVLTFLLCHKISLAIKTGDSFTHYIAWNPHFHGLMVFSITYPHSLALYECVWSASQSTCIILGENAECQLNRRLDGPEIWPGSPEEVKNLLTLPGKPNLIYSLIYPGHRLPTTPTALSQLPFYIQSYPEYMCYSCNRLFVQQPLLI